MTRREAMTSQKLAKRRVAQNDSDYMINHENADLAAKIEFSGIVFETTGGVEVSAERFFRERARESAAVTGRQVGSIFQNMMRKISAALQKGMVELLLDRLSGVLRPHKRITEQQALVEAAEGLSWRVHPSLRTIQDENEEEDDRIVCK